MIFRIVNQWNMYLDRIPEEKKDIYFTEEYTRLYETEIDTAMCIVGEDGDKVILMPFLRREVRGFYDFETAYGYGGPITNTESRVWINTALYEMQEYFKKNGYICGFVRFHPLLENAELCRDIIDVIFDRLTVVVNTRQNIEDIWTNQITSKNRNMIRKAEKYGLSYKAEYDFESMMDFVELYNMSMRRLGAEDFYYFSDNYYRNLVDCIKGKGFLSVVSFHEKVIGAAIFMYTKEYGHYHLAGSNREMGNIGTNNYLLWKTIEELSGKNISEFHLGGGTTSMIDDSLFKFKKSFSNNEKDFYIGRWIFDSDFYKNICREWSEEYPHLEDKYHNYFLKYRYRK